MSRDRKAPVHPSGLPVVAHGYSPEINAALRRLDEARDALSTTWPFYYSEAYAEEVAKAAELLEGVVEKVKSDASAVPS